MDVTSVGAFLHKLSAVERAQSRELIAAITLAAAVARVQCMTGPPATIPLGAERDRITALLSRFTGPLTLPTAADPQTYLDTLNPQQLWVELLDDLST
jgi:hypothetical protein